MPQDSLVCGMLHWCYCIRLSISHLDLFLPRDVMPARYLLSSCVRPFVRLSVCLSQAGVISKQLDKSSCFLA